MCKEVPVVRGKVISVGSVATSADAIGYDLACDQIASARQRGEQLARSPKPKPGYSFKGIRLLVVRRLARRYSAATGYLVPLEAEGSARAFGLNF